MKKLIALTIGLSFLTFAQISVAQTTLLEDLIKNFKNYTQKYPQEKIHLHTDKSYYVNGETIWLNTYVVDAKENKPSNISSIAYIELISPTNKIIKMITLIADGGGASGYIKLPDSLNSGYYRLRAYSNYMRNFEQDFFFEKYISIYNSASSNQKTTTVNTKKVNVQFFPEGGNLVLGLRCRIGIKITNENGLGLNIAGYIKDKTGEKIVDISTEHAGMGSFVLTPEKWKAYTAVFISPETNDEFETALPNIEENGFNLAVNAVNDQEDLMLKIASTADKILGQEINIIGQNNGTVYYSSKIIANAAVISTLIPKRKFPTGLAHFTIFENDIPIAERLVFIDHKDQILINVEKAKTQNPNETTLNLLITDSNKNPLDANFSVAVVDAEGIPENEDEEMSITANLLLKSDIKGFVECPNYYFNNKSLDKARQLDNLLLTQGWRRFIWSDININSARNLSLNFLPEKTLSISGTVVNLFNKPEPNAKIALFSATNGFDFMLDTIANSDGRFSFDRLDIPDTVSIFIQAKTSENLKTVKILTDLNPAILTSQLPSLPFDNKKFVDYIENNEKAKNSTPLGDGIKLKQVTIHQQKLQRIENVANSKSRNGSVDYVVSKQRIERETGNALDIFNNVPGVKMQDGKIFRAMSNTTSISPALKGKPQPMTIILDGIPVEQDVLISTPASVVEGIEILVSNYNTAIYEDGYWGVVIVTTKLGGRATDIVRTPNTNLQKLSAVGAQISKEFYSPSVKTTPQNLENEVNKLGSTFFWNPSLQTTPNGHAKLTFTHPKAKKIRLTIEGMDTFGNLGRTIYKYEIK